ncbi:hypothetical protein CesoFtcFv8_027438 [Champsocephalus esox]|uniref:RRM domain-containing protein n=1 Tax=Champsocephalus esox TaxID=159716 RepID=A0AAN7Y2Z0_9TELE|nr:hypothetical protein CesoFtcFv8_027438 [Champsocephalus esox]
METDSREEKRTVVVSGVPEVLPASRMIDKLTIHFQSCRKSRGGDVEVVKLPTSMQGVALVTFDKAEDANRAVGKEQQIMADDEFPEEYLLTVFPFSTDVFCYVSSATVDLSVFGRDPSSLIRSLRSAHRSIRFQPSPERRRATVEGPFSAVRALRQDLLLRAERLDSTAVKLKETAPNPGVPSPHSSVSRHGAIAKLGPGSANFSSPPLHTTGEETQRLHSKTHSPRRRASRERDRLEMPTESRTEQVETDPRPVHDSRSRPSLIGLEMEVSPQQSGVDDISDNRSGPERVSSSKIRGESQTESLQESDQKSPATTTKIPTRRRHVSKSSNSNTEDTGNVSAVGLEDQDDTCIWVDSYIFNYIETFVKEEFDKCSRGVDVSVRSEGADLVRLVLTERPSSTVSRLQYALGSLKDLVEIWRTLLRVHQIDYDKKDKQKLIEICKDVDVVFVKVLYMIEDSCVKVIGFSSSSHRFCQKVEERLNPKTL